MFKTRKRVFFEQLHSRGPVSPLEGTMLSKIAPDDVNLSIARSRLDPQDQFNLATWQPWQAFFVWRRSSIGQKAGTIQNLAG